MIKKIKIKTFFTVFTIISVLILSLSSCSTEPPELETVKEEYISLIEASAEINSIFFGEGLPVYDRDGTEDEKKVYVDMVEALDNYESVHAESKYLSIEAMKMAAAKVYTAEYLESVYLMVFDGYADEVSGVTTARYMEWDTWIYKSMLYEPLIEGTRTYDYDTMEIVKPSTGEYVNVSIDSYLDGEKLNITLAFSLTEDGWRLDTPTY